MSTRRRPRPYGAICRPLRDPGANHRAGTIHNQFGAHFIIGATGFSMSSVFLGMATHHHITNMGSLRGRTHPLRTSSFWDVHRTHPLSMICHRIVVPLHHLNHTICKVSRPTGRISTRPNMCTMHGAGDQSIVNIILWDRLGTYCGDETVGQCWNGHAAFHSRAAVLAFTPPDD